MTKKDNDEIAQAIRTARAHEKIAIAEAQRKASDWIREQTVEQHEVIIEAVRRALGAGMSARSIGQAYGSSDPKTAKRLILEAMGATTSAIASDGLTHSEWKLTHNADGTFNINAYSLGDARLSGFGTFKIDDDGENFSLIEGDMWIQIQLYKLGFKDTVIAEARAR